MSKAVQNLNADKASIWTRLAASIQEKLQNMLNRDSETDDDPQGSAALPLYLGFFSRFTYALLNRQTGGIRGLWQNWWRALQGRPTAEIEEEHARYADEAIDEIDEMFIPTIEMIRMRIERNGGHFPCYARSGWCEGCGLGTNPFSPES